MAHQKHTGWHRRVFDTTVTLNKIFNFRCRSEVFLLKKLRRVCRQHFYVLSCCVDVSSPLLKIRGVFQVVLLLHSVHCVNFVVNARISK